MFEMRKLGAVPIRLEAHRLIRWLRSHRGAVAMACLLSLAVPGTFFPGVAGALREPSAEVVLELTLWYALLAGELCAALLVIGYALQQSAVAQRYARVATLLAACVAAVTVEFTNGRADILIEQGIVQSEMASHAQGFLAAFIMALLFFAHLQRSRAQEQAALRLSSAQVAQREAQQRAAHARLKAVQARIDPELLFKLLDEVRRAYEKDAARAERLLDELVAFLRAALPRLRNASSDVSCEAHLARAYAQLRALAEGIVADMALDVAAGAAHARFPPGILLPLLDDALRARPGDCALRVERSSCGIELVLTLPAAPLKATVERVRAMLTDLYGAAAAFAIGPGDGVVRSVVRIPFDHA